MPLSKLWQSLGDEKEALEIAGKEKTLTFDGDCPEKTAELGHNLPRGITRGLKSPQKYVLRGKYKEGGDAGGGGVFFRPPSTL